MEAILGYGVSHPHNRYLYVTLCFGIIGLALFLLIVYYANKGTINSHRVREGRIMMAAFIALLSAAQVESLSATGGNGGDSPQHMLTARGKTTIYSRKI